MQRAISATSRATFNVRPFGSGPTVNSNSKTAHDRALPILHATQLTINQSVNQILKEPHTSTREATSQHHHHTGSKTQLAGAIAGVRRTRAEADHNPDSEHSRARHHDHTNPPHSKLRMISRRRSGMVWLDPAHVAAGRDPGQRRYIYIYTYTDTHIYIYI